MRERIPLLDKKIEILLFILFLVFLFDPGDSIFRLKFPVFGVLLFLCLWSRTKIKLIEAKFIFVFVFVTSISVIIGVLRGGDTAFAFLILKSEIVFLLIPIFRAYSGHVIELFSRACLIVSGVIILLFVAELLLPHSMIVPLYTFGNAHNSFTIDFRYYAGIRFGNVYFHSSPMLVVGNAYYVDRYLKNSQVSNLIPALMIICAFFLTGSRNNMLMAVGIPIALIFLEGNDLQKIVVCVALALSLPFVFPIAKAFLDVGDYSNSIKLGYFSIYGAAINKNLINWLIGCGLGTKVYIPAVGKNVFLTELTYLNCVYWFGLPMCLLFFGNLISPVFWGVSTDNRYIKVIYLAFLYLCSLNPFLFNSVGITVLAICLFHFIDQPNALGK